MFDWSPSYNIAPSQITPVLIFDESRRILPMQWGLIPFWAKDKKIGYKMINARAETLTEKRSYKNLLKRRRCIAITDGYFEWQKKNGSKEPFYIYRKNNEFLSMAALWDQWKSGDGQLLNTYTVVTTKPQANISHIHDRMPAIIPRENLDIWLRTDEFKPEEALKLLQPYGENLEFYPVSKAVNSPKNNSPECIRQWAGDSQSKLSRNLFSDH